MATSASNKTGSKKASSNTGKSASEELKTDFPLSEKDEIKKAEQEMKQRAKGK
ncbi:hypothetical protein [Mucilaginibacter sp. FT3.2]|uniref:hypothetical protein n=1 Tax=Mucilaginibacter sp. FT3.2 TaxID=2723090 RepID=UPI0016221F03|nr:hypothetical protein [Mucilaginibacter sp. FT3.2]MBB6234042.1 hypothetical protein [Mucilaginibacter sp. FT3.2]